MTECPVCATVLPVPASKGRPRVYCSKVCAERARQRARKAAKLLEFADRVEGCIGVPSFGIGEGAERAHRERAAELRRMAAECVAGLPS